jgi:hypothetical protein
MGFTDFDPPAELLPATTSPAAAAEPSRQPRRDEFYDMPIVDGKPVPNTLLIRLRDQMRALLMSSGEREEAQLESSLRRLPGVSRTNVVATLSPKGGCGKTTSTFLAGNVLASHLRLRALAVDLNPDFGSPTSRPTGRGRRCRSSTCCARRSRSARPVSCARTCRGSPAVFTCWRRPPIRR